jgi:hypothetical protein
VPEPSSVTLFVLGMLGITFGPLLSKKSHRFNAIDAATFGMLGGRDQDGETIIKYLAAHFGKWESWLFLLLLFQFAPGNRFASNFVKRIICGRVVEISKHKMKWVVNVFL